MTAAAKSMGCHLSEIERIHRPEPEHVRQTYVRGRKPVVITGVVEHWKAFEQWGPDYFRAVAGDMIVEGWSLPNNVLRGDVDKGALFQVQSRPFREFIDDFTAEEGSRGPLYLAQRAIKFGQTAERLGKKPGLAELGKDVEEPDYLRTTRELMVANLWMSGGGPTTSLHYDGCENFMAMIQGSKRLFLFASSQSRNLYPFPVWSKTPYMSLLDLDAVDPSRFPKLARGGSR